MLEISFEFFQQHSKVLLWRLCYMSLIKEIISLMTCEGGIREEVEPLAWLRCWVSLSPIEMARKSVMDWGGYYWKVQMSPMTDDSKVFEKKRTRRKKKSLHSANEEHQFPYYYCHPRWRDGLNNCLSTFHSHQPIMSFERTIYAKPAKTFRKRDESTNVGFESCLQNVWKWLPKQGSFSPLPRVCQWKRVIDLQCHIPTKYIWPNPHSCLGFHPWHRKRFRKNWTSIDISHFWHEEKAQDYIVAPQNFQTHTKFT